MRGYDHKKIEKKWQKEWEKKKLHTTKDTVKGKDNFYLLTEFPYPSGNLHVGHWYAFSIPDILARTLRMQGKNVLYPIGFDAFGLPAENAAIKNQLNPRKWTEKNIAYMKNQIRSMGTTFDWSREVQTIDPAYYKWTQWQFLQFFKNNLAYQKETPVNWCPSCKTVLANEQVVDGKCERCDSDVVQKHMLQWNMRITDYADRLVDDLEGLDWPEQIKESQRNWIGRSEGAEIDFPLVDKSISHFVLLHGREAHSGSVFLPWLKQKLEARGYSVEVPDMPNTMNPSDEEQTEYVMKNCKLDEKTAVLGHSFGGIVALRLLERGVKLGRVTLVGTPFSGKWKDSKKRETVRAALKKGFDFAVVKKNCGGFVALYDTNDQIVPMEDGEAYAENLGCLLIKAKGNKWHFLGTEERQVLKAAAPTISVFTTRADTLFGATYLVLAPEHQWIKLALQHKTVLQNNGEIQKYVQQAAKKSELERQENKEKTGVELKGVRAINPATGKEIPVWIADYALAHYGTGAVMGVPAHDERDFAFATKYKLSIVDVIEPVALRYTGIDGIRSNEPMNDRPGVMAVVKHPSEEKYLAVTYKPTNIRGFVSGGLDEGEDPIECAKREIREETGYTKATLVKELGSIIHSRYYSVKYKKNCAAHYKPFLFKLDDLSQGDIDPEEKATHDTAWMTAEELNAFINSADFGALWNRIRGKSYVGDGILANSGEFSGMESEEARKAIAQKFGALKKTYKMRDWVVSRQRYWGVPIPIIHCAKCGPQAVVDKDLPVKLPEVKDYLPDGRGKSPLAKAKKWVSVKCPSCKGKAERETDTLDTFVDSSWYFLRYADPKNKKKFADSKKMASWLPVNLYSGGAEHTTMHVLYSRFWHKALFDLGLVKNKEPYARRINRSLIMGPDGQKMSKSRGNVIDPDQVVERLGADTVRMYLAFIGPYNEVSSYPWNPDGVAGVRRFLERVWRCSENIQKDPVSTLENILHKTIKKVGEDNIALKFNTAISTLMIFLNAVEKEGKIGKEQWQLFLQLLAPFAPHIAEELWSESGGKGSIHVQAWPQFESTKLRDETMKIAIQVNGKTRGEIEVASDATKENVEKFARTEVAARLEGKKLLRTIVVPNRLVNFVIED